MLIKKMIAVCTFAVSALTITPAMAAYPEKPITLVCWSSPGSGHDLMARYIAKLGEKYIGQPIVVVNKKGGKGKVAMSYVLNQKSDGYVIMTNTRSMTKRLKPTGGSIAIDSFKYISRVVQDPFVIVVKEDSPFNTMSELVTYAKNHPNKIKVGGYSTQSVDEGLVHDIEKISKINLNYIPYKGGKEPVVAVLGGHIDVAIANPSEMMTSFQAGKLKALAVTTEDRFSPFDDTPTLKEQDINNVTVHWRGVMASKDVPDEAIQKLDNMIQKVLEEPEFKKFLNSSNMLSGYIGSEKFGEYVAQQTKK